MAHEDILYGFVEHVPHVEHARHVGRRNDHGERLAAVGFRTEQLVLHPIFIPFALNVFGTVFACEFHWLKFIMYMCFVTKCKVMKNRGISYKEMRYFENVCA